MKGSDETHGVGLGSSLHGSLLLVLFLKFCLVFCLLDLVVVVVVVGGGGGGGVVDDGDGCEAKMRKREKPK
jgi:hypothetical protein